MTIHTRQIQLTKMHIRKTTPREESTTYNFNIFPHTYCTHTFTLDLHFSPLFYPHIIEKKRLQWYGHVKRMPEERIPKLIMEWIPLERRKRGLQEKNMDGRSKSSHDNKKFRTRSMEKQRGMAFGFRKTATAVIKTDR
jgi:Tfp pilus assembly pilus retraction ATPase PilT